MFRKVVLGIIVLILISFFSVLKGDIVSVDLAEEIAANWYKHWSVDKDTSIPAVNETHILQYEDENSIYVFTMEEGGYVLVAADDASTPVLGYSFNSDFDESLLNTETNIQYWFDKYHKEISEIKKNNLSNSETILLWNDIISNKFELYPLSSKGGGRDVEPLITSTWNQGNPYNIYCPMDGGSRSVVGCVATAMAMIMQYHEHPSHGDGEHEYYWGSTPLYVNFGETAYNWDAMTSSISSSSTPEAIHEVAQLSYHCGVAVEMGYGASGSGAWSEMVASSLVEYFNYNNSLSYVAKSDYSASGWINLLKADLDQSRPIYYDGYSDSGGHAFICDGYQSNDFFHFNWGWGGTDNGYFNVDALNTGAGAFNNWQHVIQSVFPNEEDLIITENISDQILIETSTTVDLSEHFQSVGGNQITYAIASNSNTNAVGVSISGDILTLNRGSENGISTIHVIANTSTEQYFDFFDVKVMDQKPLAGFGNTYNFAGTSFIDAGDSQSVNDLNLLSVTAWVKLNSLSGRHSVISKNSSTNSGWYFNITDIDKIKFLVKGQDGNSRKLYSSSTIPMDVWVHLAGTYDGQRMRLYVNGEIDRENFYDDYQEILNNDNVNLFIARSTSYYLDGSLDDVRLWNRGISQYEVIDAMNSTLSGNENDLIGYWKIDENFGGTIEDFSNFNNNGTIQGLNNYNWLSESSEISPLRYCSFASSLTGTLLGNEGDDITFELVDNSSGQAVLDNSTTGEFTFTPNGSSSVDEFSYKISQEGVFSEVIKVFIDNDLVGIEGDDNYELSIMNYELKQNYPNPFNPITRINYELGITNYETAEIVVYNAMGQMVWSSQLTAHSSQLTGSVLFDGSKFNSGVYYYSLVIDGKRMSSKAMILIK